MSVKMYLPDATDFCYSDTLLVLKEKERIVAIIGRFLVNFEAF